MASYKTTLVTFVILVILVVIGTLVFTAIEGFEYHESFSLTLQIFTTVGYGNFPPKTNPGKIFCIFFSMIGIPVNIVLLQKIGEHMMNAQKIAISKIETKLFKISQPKYVGEKSLALCLINLVLVVMIGAMIQVYHANWTFLDGVYCYVVTFTTVGFGDFIPGFDTKNVPTIVILSIFNLLGLCVVSTTINCAIECKIPFSFIQRLCGKKTVTSEENEVRTEMTL